MLAAAVYVCAFKWLSPIQNTTFCAEGAAAMLAGGEHVKSSSRACSPSTTRLKRRIGQKQLEKASNTFLSAIFKVEVGTTDVQ
jgi:hypothetical protein